MPKGRVPAYRTRDGELPTAITRYVNAELDWRTAHNRYVSARQSENQVLGWRARGPSVERMADVRNELHESYHAVETAREELNEAWMSLRSVMAHEKRFKVL